jgi:hypothetical protein
VTVPDHDDPGRAKAAGQSDPAAAAHRLSPGPVARQGGFDAATTRPGRRQRLPYGHLQPLVLAHLSAYPQTSFTPWELGHVLGHSHGTIRRILVRLAATGAVDQTSWQPDRFRHHH